jgi:hypothetical protein
MGFILHTANRYVSHIIALARAKVQDISSRLETVLFVAPNAPTIKLFAIDYRPPR